MALDAQTGKSLWQTFTIDEVSKPGRPTKGGAETKGPSGAGIWSAPTIDSQKGILYAATGDDYSDPPSNKSDAVLALSSFPSKKVWNRALTVHFSTSGNLLIFDRSV